MSKKKRKIYTVKDINSGLAKGDNIIQVLISLAESGEKLMGEEVFELAPIVYNAITKYNVPITNGQLLDCDFYCLILLYGDDPTVFKQAKSWDGIIPYIQKEKDIFRLENYATKWFEEIINTDRHKDPILYEIALEGRNQLRELDKNVEYTENGILRKNFRYKKAWLGLIIKNKYIYLKNKQIFDYEPKPEFIFKFNTLTVGYSYLGHIHILSRHYGQLLSCYNTNKSYHSENIPYDMVHIVLKEIGVKLSEVGMVLQVVNKSNYRIFIRYKKIFYTLYIEETPSHLKNTLSATYQVKTFYPTENIDEQAKIARLREVVIDSTTSYFVESLKN